jgi:hypothetical protein
MKRLTSSSDEGSICLIAVMGVTGSGKSNFIRHLTGSSGENGPIVGHDLASCETSYGPEESNAADKRKVRPRQPPSSASSAASNLCSSTHRDSTIRIGEMRISSSISLRR